MPRALKRSKRPYRAWLAEHPDRKAIFERLEWLAWSTILWGLDTGDPKVIRFYRANFRRLPDGSVRFKKLSRSELLKGIEPRNGSCQLSVASCQNGGGAGWRSEPRGHGPEVPSAAREAVRVPG